MNHQEGKHLDVAHHGRIVERSVATLGAGAEIAPTIQEKADHVDVAAQRGFVQQRKSVRIDFLEAGTLLDEPFHQADVTRTTRLHQSASESAFLRNVRTGLEQEIDDILRTVANCLLEWRAPQAIPGLRVRTMLEEESHHADVISLP